MSEEDWGLVLWGLIALLVLLPAKWDPAIRLKEWTTKRRKR